MSELKKLPGNSKHLQAAIDEYVRQFEEEWRRLTMNPETPTKKKRLGRDEMRVKLLGGTRDSDVIVVPKNTHRIMLPIYDHTKDGRYDTEVYVYLEGQTPPKSGKPHLFEIVE